MHLEAEGSAGMEAAPDTEKAEKQKPAPTQSEPVPGASGADEPPASETGENRPQTESKENTTE